MAEREVVLCAGAIGTPQLLQLSGIGARGPLEAVGIEVVHEAPGVGEHLLDHLANGLLRHRFGYTPKTSNLRGPSFFAKKVLQKLVRDSKWVKRERNARRAIDFRLDATEPGRIVDLQRAA